MLIRWSDWPDTDRTLSAMDEFRRRMDRLFDEFDGYERGRAGLAPRAWPRAELWDQGSALTLTAELPGLSEKDIKLTVNQDALTLEGERRVTAPEGYSVHRQERRTYRFARSFAFPSRVDVERASAQMRNGVLTVTLPKAPEAQPRQIRVRAES